VVVRYEVDGSDWKLIPRPTNHRDTDLQIGTARR
jgi:hypothetical protein